MKRLHERLIATPAVRRIRLIHVFFRRIRSPPVEPTGLTFRKVGKDKWRTLEENIYVSYLHVSFETNPYGTG